MKPCLNFEREGDASTLSTLSAALAIEYPDDAVEHAAAVEIITLHMRLYGLDRTAKDIGADLRRRLDDLARDLVHAEAQLDEFDR